MYKSIAVVALAALAVAAPAPGSKPASPKPAPKPQQPQYNAVSYTATFDDLKPLTENAALVETGPYDGLDYKGIDTVELGVAGAIVAGVIPHSSPNAGAYGATTELTQGEPEITSDYPGTVTTFFDFQQFYFGCVAGTVEAVASAPLGCSVTVTGYRESNEVATKTFKFSPGLGLTAPMVKASLGDKFKKIDYVKFDSTYDLPDVGATLLDDLKYVAYSSKKSAEGGKGKSGSSYSE